MKRNRKKRIEDIIPIERYQRSNYLEAKRWNENIQNRSKSEESITKIKSSIIKNGGIAQYNRKEAIKTEQKKKRSEWYIEKNY